ncbi:MAG TPA: HAMP domain-containing sensor histidine kinase [Nitrososphaeraceae archaeon]
MDNHAGLNVYVNNLNQHEKQNQNLIESNKQQAKTIERLKINIDRQKEFISIAAHELKTPIMPIIAIAELLEEEECEEESKEVKVKKDYIHTVIRNAKALERLASNILDVTRIENYSLIVGKEMINLSKLISNVVQDYKQQILKLNLLTPSSSSTTTTSKTITNRRSIKLSYHSEHSNIVVEGDEIRLTQVISNLLNNAIKFTKTSNDNDDNDAEINITLQKKNGSAIVAIKDNGIGIDSNVFPRLFSKFTTTTRISSSGAGLGLYICKNIIEAHGGKISAENNQHGRGATFAFSLPVS